MEGDENSIENLTRYINQIKAKEEQLKLREQKLNEYEQSSTAHQYEERIKVLESELDRKSAELDEKKEQVEQIRLIIGLQNMSSKELELRVKESELNTREQQLMKKEAEMLGDYRKLAELEFKEKKAKTGNSRLDDLLYGGITFGKNVLINGPPFIGKETFTNQFVLEGLVKGIPALMITTDSSPNDILDELRYISPDVDKYVENGSLMFIDAYSKPMGITSEMNNAICIEHPTDYKGFEKAFNEIASKFEERAPYFRTVVRSVSSMTTFTDMASSYRFLQQLTAKNKVHKNVAMYLLDKGMHSEPEIQTLSHLMDGAIEFKTDGTKTYLRVQDICDAQTRDWVKYDFTKRGLNLGVFTLDHIK